MANIIDGKRISLEIQEEIRQGVSEFVAQLGIKPCLAAVIVGTNPASEVYVRNKRRDCVQVGIESQLHRLDSNASCIELQQLVARLNEDAGVHGVLVQLPLPPQIDQTLILDQIRPLKDVDAFHPENVGLLSQGRPRFLPCTPYGIQQMLHRSGLEVAGKHVVVVGRSDIVGKPLASMLVQRDSACGPTAANATVTLCHSRTPVLVAAIGRPRMITAEMVRPGAIVVDVGINRTQDGLVGDVDFSAVKEIASHITPVPGGVGPLTRTMLLHNTLASARLQVCGV